MTIPIGLYQHRVISNGEADIKLRFGLFKTTFRTKLNNWLVAHAAKIQPDEPKEIDEIETYSIENMTNTKQNGH